MKYQIRGCIEVHVVGMGLFVEEAPDEDAEFFGLYEKDADGKFMWVSDHKTRKEAEIEMQKYQPLKYWKVSFIGECGIPCVATFKTREQARRCKKQIVKKLGVDAKVYKCSYQDMGNGIYIEVSEKVH